MASTAITGIAFALLIPVIGIALIAAKDRPCGRHRAVRGDLFRMVQRRRHIHGLIGVIQVLGCIRLKVRCRGIRDIGEDGLRCLRASAV